MAAGVSRQDESFREYALTGPVWRVLLAVCLPLALYQALQSIFTVMDALMAAHISAGAVSSVTVFKQISSTLSAIGGGLAVGGCVKISEAYGRGDYDAVRRQVSTLYALAVCVGAVLIVVLIPFAEPFVRIFNRSDELIATGLGYFRVEVMTLVASFFNTVYIAIERARGHSRKILVLNLAVVVTKLSLTAVFVYALDCGVTMIGVATLVGQLALMVYAVISMFCGEGAFRFSFQNIEWRKRTVLPILKLSYPVTVEKMLFSAGKAKVQDMAVMYGSLTAGALGLSNNIGGLTTGWQSGIQDGAAPLVSQNRGAERYRRTLEIYIRLVVVNVLIGLIGLAIVSQTLPWLAQIFAQSKNQFDASFQQMIVDIHRWEMLGYITLGLHAATLALLLGYGYTKLTLLLNALRILSRLGVLWLFQNFSTMGVEAVGLTMMISNITVGVAAIVVAIPVIARIKRKLLAEEAETTPQGGQ